VPVAEVDGEVLHVRQDLQDGVHQRNDLLLEVLHHVEDHLLVQTPPDYRFYPLLQLVSTACELPVTMVLRPFQVGPRQLPRFLPLDAKLLEDLLRLHAGSHESEGLLESQVPGGEFQPKLLEVEAREGVANEGAEVLLEVGKTDVGFEGPVRDLNADVLAVDVHACDCDEVEEVGEVGVRAASEVVGMQPDCEERRVVLVERVLDHAGQFLQVLAIDVEPIQDQFEANQIGQRVKALLDEREQVALDGFLVAIEITVGVALQ
jgi:hypothetical protein